MDLDAMLDRAAPPNSAENPTVGAELRSLALRAETDSRRSRRRSRMGAVVAGGAGLVVVATGVSAVGLVPQWLPWSTQDGTTCEVGFRAYPATDSGGQNLSDEAAAMSTSATDAAVTDAQTFLDGIDLASIDVPAAIADFQRDEARVRASQTPAERQPKLRGDDLDISAVGAEVSEQMADYLRSQGTDPTAVELSRANRCR